MKYVQSPNLADFITLLVGDAVTIQQKMDSAFEQDAVLYAELLARTPAAYRSLMEPLEPQRQLLRTFEVSATARLESGRSTGFSLTALPLNIGYSIRFRVLASGWSNLQATVEQIPTNERMNNG